MRELFVDCSVGVAGDMLTAALLDLFPNREEILAELNALGIPHVIYKACEKNMYGVNGLHVDVIVDGHIEGDQRHTEDDDAHAHHHGANRHAHRGLDEVKTIIGATAAPASVKQDAFEVYELIAQAEAEVHGGTISDIHFHEVGTMDAIADVLAVSYLIAKLDLDRICASPINVGSGTVECAHGILPVPTPATALLLKGIAHYGSDIACELCTPTGAALIKHFAVSFGSQPCMIALEIGYGFGTREFGRLNCVRAILGDAYESGDDVVVELSCNIDDMTGEEIGFACQELLERGALDVFTTPIQMKKFRPAILLTVICESDRSDEFAQALMNFTSTLGVRKKMCARYTQRRHIEARETPYGTVRVKHSSGFGVTHTKIEYDDLAAIAHEQGVSLNAAHTLLRLEHEDDEGA